MIIQENNCVVEPGYYSAYKDLKPRSHNNMDSLITYNPIQLHNKPFTLQTFLRE